MATIWQYEVAVDSNPQVCQRTPLVKQICYGILQEILVCKVMASLNLGTSTHILTLVSDSGSHSDATLIPTSFTALQIQLRSSH